MCNGPTWQLAMGQKGAMPLPTHHPVLPALPATWQLAMGQRLEAEARAKQAAALRQLKEQLDQDEAIDAPIPIY